MIFAAVTLAAGTLFSCSDDDDNNKNGSESQNVDGVEGMSEMMLAMYWQHEIVFMYNCNNRLIWDMTKDWRDHPDPEKSALFLGDERYWYKHNITSTELTFTDGGKKRSNADNIYVKSQVSGAQ